MKLISYTVEVVLNGEIKYYREGSQGVVYRNLEDASTTTDFSTLGEWEDYVKNDFAQGDVTSYQNVEIELKASTANVDGDIHDSLEADALAKLTPLDRQVLGL